MVKFFAPYLRLLSGVQFLAGLVLGLVAARSTFQLTSSLHLSIPEKTLYILINLLPFIFLMAASLGLWNHKRWGWWLTNVFYLTLLLKAIIEVVSLPSNRFGNIIFVDSLYIVISLVVIVFMFNAHVKSASGVKRSNRYIILYLILASILVYASYIFKGLINFQIISQ